MHAIPSLSKIKENYQKLIPHIIQTPVIDAMNTLALADMPVPLQNSQFHW